MLTKRSWPRLNRKKSNQKNEGIVLAGHLRSRLKTGGQTGFSHLLPLDFKITIVMYGAINMNISCVDCKYNVYFSEAVENEQAVAIHYYQSMQRRNDEQKPSRIVYMLNAEIKHCTNGNSSWLSSLGNLTFFSLWFCTFGIRLANSVITEIVASFQALGN